MLEQQTIRVSLSSHSYDSFESMAVANVLFVRKGILHLVNVLVPASIADIRWILDILEQREIGRAASEVTAAAAAASSNRFHLDVFGAVLVAVWGVFVMILLAMPVVVSPVAQ